MACCGHEVGFRSLRSSLPMDPFRSSYRLQSALENAKGQCVRTCLAFCEVCSWLGKPLADTRMRWEALGSCSSFPWQQIVFVPFSGARWRAPRGTRPANAQAAMRADGLEQDLGPACCECMRFPDSILDSRKMSVMVSARNPRRLPAQSRRDQNSGLGEWLCCYGKQVGN